jgi:hypothetical protein
MWSFDGQGVPGQKGLGSTFQGRLDLLHFARPDEFHRHQKNPIRGERRGNSAQIPGIGATAPVSAGTQPSRTSNDSTDKPPYSLHPDT